MVEDYRIIQRFGHSQKAGINKDGSKITKYVLVYRTPAGELSREEWMKRIETAVEQEGEGELLEVIHRHCEQFSWLHTDDQIMEYALEILASRTFLCGSDAWKDVEAEARDKGLVAESMSYQRITDLEHGEKYQPLRKASVPAEPALDIVQEASGQLRFA